MSYCYTYPDLPRIGAFLAIYLSLRKFNGLFEALHLIYPVLDVFDEHPSYECYGNNYFLDADKMKWFKSFITNYCSDIKFNPMELSQEDMDTLPDINIYSAGFDVLRDESFIFSDKYRLSRKMVIHHHFGNLPHDFCLYSEFITSAKSALNVIAKNTIVSKLKENKNVN